MGLYDNWKQTYSTAVPTFVPDHSKQIAGYIDEANKRYETTQALMSQTQELLKTAPIRAQDQGMLNKITEDAQAHLQEYSNRPDLENVTGEVYNLAQQVTSKVKDLTQENANYQEWLKSLDDKKLDKTTKDRLIAYNNDISTPVRYDASGRKIAGTGFIPVTVAANVDRQEKINKVLSMIPDSKWRMVQSGDNGTVSYTDGVTYTDKLPPVIAKQLAAAMRLDPEWTAMNRQEAFLNTHEMTKGVSDEAVLQALQYPPKDNADAVWYKEIKASIAEGKSPSQALKEATNNREYARVNQNNLEVALGGAKHDIEIESKDDLGYIVKAQAEAQAKIKAEKEDYSDWVGQGAAIQVNSLAVTGKELNEKLSVFDDNAQALDAKINEANIVLKDPTATIESKLRAQASIEKTKKAKEVNAYRRSFIEKGQRELLDRASEKEFKQSWSTIQAEDKKTVNKVVNSYYKDGKVRASDGSIVTTEEIMNAYMQGEITLKEDKVKSPNDRFQTTSYYTVINGKTIPDKHLYNILTQQSSKTARVRGIAADMATSNIAIKTTQIPITNEKDIKALKQVIQGVTIYDPSGASTLSTDGKDIKWENTTIGAFVPELNMVHVQLSDGTQGLADMSNFSFNKKVGSELSISSDPYVKALGEAIKSNNFQTYLQTFNQASGLITKHPVDPTADIVIEGKKYGLLTNPEDNTVSLIDLSTGKIETDTKGNLHAGLSMFEVTQLLDNALKK